MESVKITIPGTLRIKKNNKRIYGNGKFKKVLPSKAYLDWEMKARWLIFGAIGHEEHRIFPLKIDLHVEVKVYYKGLQMDLSGAMESIGDCLEGVIWKNDKQIKSWDGSRLFHDKDNPRTEIVVRRFEK